ncbi:MAG: hypothetical protein K1X94_09130 [Sandaracinaceae bacterium]|jgi:hypothetical protein|nr:hypothetical protein [Sandaracinaceae bacterium]
MAKRGKGAAPAGAFVTQARQAKKTALAAREKKLSTLVALIQRRKTRIVEDFYDIGEALRTIRDEALHEARGLRFEAFVKEVLELPASTAFKLIAIVEQVPRERAIELGQEKSYALVTYAAATAEADSPVSLVTSDATIAGKPVSRASAAEIRAAASATREKQKAPSASRAQAAEDRAILAALRPLRLGEASISRRGKTLTIRITPGASR